MENLEAKIKDFLSVNSGDGSGDGSGYGYDHGHGYGHGSGYGYGLCDGSGNSQDLGGGNGDSHSLLFLNGMKIYVIDEIPTLINSVKKSIAHCSIVKEDLTLEECWVVKDGNHFAHGKTIKEAREDLLFKVLDKDKSEFENLTLDDTLSVKDAIQCYRIITGACSIGVRDFCSKLELKDEYSISEIIGLTKNSYGSDVFLSFFNK